MGKHFTYKIIVNVLIGCLNYFTKFENKTNTSQIVIILLICFTFQNVLQICSVKNPKRFYKSKTYPLSHSHLFAKNLS